MPRKITRGKSTFLSIDFLVQLLIYSCSAQEKFTRFISFRVFERNQVLFLFRRNEIKKTEKLSSEAYDSNTIYLWHSHHRQFRYESESQYSKSQLSSKIKPKLQILGTSISIQKSSGGMGALPSTNINTNVPVPSICSVLIDINPSVCRLFCYSCYRAFPHHPLFPGYSPLVIHKPTSPS